MFIFCNNNSWNLSLAESGVCVTRGKTKSECMEKLKKFVGSRGKDKFVKLVREKTGYVMNQIGVNPRYKAV